VLADGQEDLKRWALLRPFISADLHPVRDAEPLRQLWLRQAVAFALLLDPTTYGLLKVTSHEI
jgi:hypothetical protein